MTLAYLDTYDFDRMNETDVREAIVAPLLRQLGYRHSSENDIVTELTLRYEKISLGRKKDSDPVLRGKADYVLEVDKRLRWVVEVKAPAEGLDDDVREQAYTYAVHPEVQGLYYVVTNGRQWEVHRTFDGLGKAPVLTFSHAELEAKYNALANIVSPDALRRDYPKFQLDVGEPLGPGLRSFAKIVNGSVIYRTCDPKLLGPSIVGLVQHVREGTIERSARRIYAYLKLSSGRAEVDEFNRLLGLEVFDLSTDDIVASTDQTKPTVFARSLEWTIPKGARLPSPVGGPRLTLPKDLLVQSHTTARGVLRGLEFEGTFEVAIQMSMMPGTTIRTGGDFKVTVS